jgi:hypothetical protein
MEEENKKLRDLLKLVKRTAPTDEPPAPEDILAMIRSRQAGDQSKTNKKVDIY